MRIPRWYFYKKTWFWRTLSYLKKYTICHQASMISWTRYSLIVRAIYILKLKFLPRNLWEGLPALVPMHFQINKLALGFLSHSIFCKIKIQLIWFTYLTKACVTLWWYTFTRFLMVYVSRWLFKINRNLKN